MTFDAMWEALRPIGRDPSTGGYRRFAWSPADLSCREWFESEAAARGLDVHVDRNGNQWAWLGDPDRDGPGAVTGSHLDSVPDGGAFDGPLGVLSGFAAVDLLRSRGHRPSRPLAVVNFTDEEGARFGVACAGSRLMTGALDPTRALGLTDDEGVTLADAMRGAGLSPEAIGKDVEGLQRVGAFVELHVEQGRHLAELEAPLGVASQIWPHGRWRLDLRGEANHAGTTRLEDRRDPMLDLARAVLVAREQAERRQALATVGRVRVVPGGTNAIPSLVQAWLDARGPAEEAVRDLVAAVGEAAGSGPVEESWSPLVDFDTPLRDQVRAAVSADIGDAPAQTPPVLPTGAGHDAGVLAGAGVPAAMVFVRNPTGVSHSPAENALREDCLAGIEALAAVLAELTGPGR